MASDKSRVRSEMLQFHVDEAMRKNLERSFHDFREKKKKQMQERNATLLQMTRYRNQLEGQAKPADGDPKTAKAIDGLLGRHAKLAKQKLAPPKAVPLPGGIVAGRISLTVTPPYHSSQVIPSVDAGGYEPVLVGTANESAGQLSSKAVTVAEPGYSGGDMYTTIGIYFYSMVPGTLTAYVNPIYSFEWWTESYVPTATVSSFLDGSLNIYGSNPTSGPPTYETIASQSFVHFDEQQPGPLILKDGFNLQGSASVSVPVDPSQVYRIFVSADAAVFGLGSLGSIAGSILSVTVPSISYDFEMQPIVRG